MQAIGIYHNTFARVHKEKNSFRLIEAGQTQTAATKGELLATALETSKAIRRELLLPLRKEKEVLAALPFQVESVIPFPTQEAIIIPLLIPDEEGNTKAILFATTQTALSEHIENYPASDVVSIAAIALGRYGIFQHPEIAEFFILYQGSAVAVVNGSITLIQSYELGQEERLAAFIKSKYANAKQICTVHPCAIAIGLAIEAMNPTVQLRFGKFQSQRVKKQATRQKFLFTIATSVITAAICALGIWRLNALQNKLQASLDTHTGISNLPLKERIAFWQQKQLTEQKQLRLSLTTFTARDLLAWLSTLDVDVDINKLQYALYQYPKLGESSDPYIAKVELSFTAHTPAAARKFRELLSTPNSLVDTDRPFSWQPTESSYQCSFFLRSRF